MTACALSANATRALTVGDDGRLALWSLRRGARVVAFDRPGVPLTAVSASMRGGGVAIGDAHGGVGVLLVTAAPGKKD